MNESNTDKPGWKKRLVHEVISYWINFIYLACFFGVFTWYRRLVLAEYNINYTNYGVAIIEALILAKIILIGDYFRLGQRREEEPLFYRTIYKTFMFTILVGVFSLAEQAIRGFLDGKGMFGFLEEFKGRGKYELIARCFVMFFAFIPFFAFKELSSYLGKGKMKELFFGKRKPKGEPAHTIGGTSDAPAH